MAKDIPRRVGVLTTDTMAGAPKKERELVRRNMAWYERHGPGTLPVALSGASVGSLFGPFGAATGAVAAPAGMLAGDYALRKLQPGAARKMQKSLVEQAKYREAEKTSAMWDSFREELISIKTAGLSGALIGGAAGLAGGQAVDPRYRWHAAAAGALGGGLGKHLLNPKVLGGVAALGGGAYVTKKLMDRTGHDLRVADAYARQFQNPGRINTGRWL